MNYLFNIVLLCSVIILLGTTCKKHDQSYAIEIDIDSISDITTNSAKEYYHSECFSRINVLQSGILIRTSREDTWDTIYSNESGCGNKYVQLKNLEPHTFYYTDVFIRGFSGYEYDVLKMTTGWEFTTARTVPASSPIKFNESLSYGSVKDIDGNTYKTIQIGTQTWMAENLRTTKLNDGTAIPFTSLANMENATNAAYTWQSDSSNYFKIFGVFYNKYVIKTEHICPVGWHVPTENDWNILVNYAGGKDIAGEKLKEISNVHWAAPNHATNELGFTALPLYDNDVFTIFWGEYMSENLPISSTLTHDSDELSIDSAIRDYGCIRCVENL